jgi:predicted small lipoprotein YifL
MAALSQAARRRPDLTMTVLQRYVPILLTALLAVGCGQKGPLYLERLEPPPQQAPAPKKPPQAAPQPAPAEQEPSHEEQH